MSPLTFLKGDTGHTGHILPQPTPSLHRAAPSAPPCAGRKKPCLRTLPKWRRRHLTNSLLSKPRPFCCLSRKASFCLNGREVAYERVKRAGAGPAASQSGAAMRRGVRGWRFHGEGSAARSGRGGSMSLSVRYVWDRGQERLGSGCGGCSGGEEAFLWSGRAAPPPCLCQRLSAFGAVNAFLPAARPGAAAVPAR